MGDRSGDLSVESVACCPYRSVCWPGRVAGDSQVHRTGVGLVRRDLGFQKGPNRPPAPLMGRTEMAALVLALGPISADVRHKAVPPPGPCRSPPALLRVGHWGPPWDHAPPVCRLAPRIWPHRRPPNRTRFGPGVSSISTWRASSTAACHTAHAHSRLSSPDNTNPASRSTI